MKAIINTLCAFTAVLSLSATAQTEKPPEDTREPVAADTEEFLLKTDLWDTDIKQFDKDHQKFLFKWLSSAKRGLRSEGEKITTFGVDTGEIIFGSNQGKNIKTITISLYNKGDDKKITVNALKALTKKMSERISAKTGTSPEKSTKKGAITVQKSLWKFGKTAFLLEASISRADGAEFLRLRVASTKTLKDGNQTANRSSLKGNVVEDRVTGDVYLENIPMVDQGKKGYCACASAARIYQYYGLTIDQHEIAQMAGSTAAGGTSIVEMVTALKKASSELDARVLINYEYPKNMTDKESNYKKYLSGNKEMMRDINAYQQLAKKKGGTSFNIKGEKPYARIPHGYTVSFQGFIQDCDPEIYREVMMKKSSFKRWKSKIEDFIDQGIPVGWCLQLGLFPEPGLPQASGGHMRLIIGYNKKTDQIIYSDSWGEGHAKKSMDAGKAFCMTNVTLVLPPSR